MLAAPPPTAAVVDDLLSAFLGLTGGYVRATPLAAPGGQRLGYEVAAQGQLEPALADMAGRMLPIWCAAAAAASRPAGPRQVYVATAAGGACSLLPFHPPPFTCPWLSTFDFAASTWPPSSGLWRRGARTSGAWWRRRWRGPCTMCCRCGAPGGGGKPQRAEATAEAALPVACKPGPLSVPALCEACPAHLAAAASLLSCCLCFCTAC